VFTNGAGDPRRRPIPIPTRTSVSSDALPLINKSSSHSTTFFSNRHTIVEPPTQHREEAFNKGFVVSTSRKERIRTECKVTKLLSALDKVALRHCRLDTTDHHSANTHRHDSSKLRTINRHNLACVFAINVQCRPDRLWLYTQTHV
jgi:hypothetical protein